MIIASAKLYRYVLPLQRALLLRTRRLERRTGYLVEFTDEAGNRGIGEAAPLPGFSREWVYETKEQLQRSIGLLIGEDSEDARANFDEMWRDSTSVYPSVRFCILTALMTLTAASRGESLATYFNPRARPFVTLNALITRDMRDNHLELVRIRDSGYRSVKIKVGSGSPDEDAASVRRLASFLGDQMVLRIDANRSWPLPKALRFAEAIAGLNVEYIEEPVRTVDELRLFAERSAVPFALDETLCDEVIEPDLAQRAAAWVAKPTLAGLRVLDRKLADDQAPSLIVSSSYESGYGLAVLACLAAGVNGADVPAGLDTYAWLADDILAKALPLPSPLIRVEDAVAAMATVDLDRCEEMDW